MPSNKQNVDGDKKSNFTYRYEFPENSELTDFFTSYTYHFYYNKETDQINYDVTSDNNVTINEKYDNIIYKNINDNDILLIKIKIILCKSENLTKNDFFNQFINGLCNNKRVISAIHIKTNQYDDKITPLNILYPLNILSQKGHINSDYINSDHTNYNTNLINTIINKIINKETNKETNEINEEQKNLLNVIYYFISILYNNKIIISHLIVKCHRYFNYIITKNKYFHENYNVDYKKRVNNDKVSGVENHIKDRLKDILKIVNNEIPVIEKIYLENDIIVSQNEDLKRNNIDYNEENIVENIKKIGPIGPIEKIETIKPIKPIKTIETIETIDNVNPNSKNINLYILFCYLTIYFEFSFFKENLKNETFFLDLNKYKNIKIIFSIKKILSEKFHIDENKEDNKEDNNLKDYLDFLNNKVYIKNTLQVHAKEQIFENMFLQKISIDNVDTILIDKMINDTLDKIKEYQYKFLEEHKIIEPTDDLFN
jgi:hypothetical protein